MVFLGCDPDGMRATARELDSVAETLEQIVASVVSAANDLEWTGADQVAFMREATRLGRGTRQGLAVSVQGLSADLTAKAAAQDEVSSSLAGLVASFSPRMLHDWTWGTMVPGGWSQNLEWNHPLSPGSSGGGSLDIRVLYDAISKETTLVNTGKWLVPGIKTFAGGIGDLVQGIPLDATNDKFMAFSDQILGGAEFPLNADGTAFFPGASGMLKGADVAGKALDYISLGIDSRDIFSIANQGELFTDAGIRKGIDVAWDVAGIAYPPVGMVKGAWDVGAFVGTQTAEYLEERYDISGSFVDSTLIRLHGTTNLSVPDAEALAHRYDGVEGFGMYLGDSVLNAGSAVVSVGSSITAAAGNFLNNHNPFN